MGTDVKSGLPNMTAGRELDALIAERVMGFTIVDRDKNGPIFNYIGPQSRRYAPFYSTDITAAWSVVEKLQTQACVWDLVEDKGGWFATVHCYGPERHYGEWASTAPFSICLAALKWADSR